MTVAWFSTFSGFGIIAAVAIWRAHQIIKSAPYSSDITSAVRDYLRSLWWDIGAAAALAVISLAAALANVWVSRPVIQDQIFAGGITVGLIASLVSHELTAAKLRHAIHS